MSATAERGPRLDYVVVMGVCGVGKSTIGRALAEAIGGDLIEADDHHSEENIRRMSQGRPLDDEQRWPWLETVAAAAADLHRRTDRPVVIACSALKRRYRDRLRERLGAFPILHLSGPYALLRGRLEARRSHFMPPALLDSQLADLEPLDADERGVVLSVELPPAEIVERMRAALVPEPSSGEGDPPEPAPAAAPPSGG